VTAVLGPSRYGSFGAGGSFNARCQAPSTVYTDGERLRGSQTNHISAAKRRCWTWRLRGRHSPRRTPNAFGGCVHQPGCGVTVEHQTRYRYVHAFDDPPCSFHHRTIPGPVCRTYRTHLPHNSPAFARRNNGGILPPPPPAARSRTLVCIRRATATRRALLRFGLCHLHYGTASAAHPARTPPPPPIADRAPGTTSPPHLPRTHAGSHTRTCTYRAVLPPRADGWLNGWAVYHRPPLPGLPVTFLQLSDHSVPLPRLPIPYLRFGLLWFAFVGSTDRWTLFSFGPHRLVRSLYYLPLPHRTVGFRVTRRT